MKNRLKNIFAIFLIASLSGTVMAQAQTIVMNATQQKNLGIRLSKLQAAGQMVGQTYPAEVVVPVNQVRVVSTIHAGLVSQLMVTTGQTVQKGQPLARITSPELLTIQRAYLQSSAQRRLTQQSLDRDNALYKEGIIAQKRLQSSENAHHESSAQQNEQRQQLKLAGLSEQAIRQLERNGQYQHELTLMAPISGTVLEQMVAQGQHIDATTPLLKIAQVTPLWVEAQVPLAEVKRQKIQKGAHVFVKDQNANGQVIALLPSIKAQNQTAIVRAEIRQGADLLFPSQMVDVQIASTTLSADARAFIVPTAALVHHQSRTVVFIKTAAGFEVRDVNVLSTQGESSSISGHFSGAEEIAIAGTAAIKASWQGMGGGE